MNLRQAAQQALEALEEMDSNDSELNQEWLGKQAITALRAALAEPNKCAHGVTDKNCKECYMAEPEQEPVAWMWRDGTVTSDPDRADGTWTPLYTTPPQRKPLTDEEIEQAYRHIYHNVPDGSYRTTYYWIEQGIRYAEQAHGIKGDA